MAADGRRRSPNPLNRDEHTPSAPELTDGGAGLPPYLSSPTDAWAEQPHHRPRVSGSARGAGSPAPWERCWYVLFSPLLRRVARDDESTSERQRKEILLPLMLTAAVMYALWLVGNVAFGRLIPALVNLGLIAFPASTIVYSMVTRRFPLALAEAAVVAQVVLLACVFDVFTFGQYELWALSIVGADALLLAGCRARASFGLCVIVGCFLVFKSVEEAEHSLGLYRWIEEHWGDMMQKGVPPATGYDRGVSLLCVRLVVYTIDFSLTRFFAVGMQAQQRRVLALVRVAQSIAQALVRFDLDGAEALVDADGFGGAGRRPTIAPKTPLGPTSPAAPRKALANDGAYEQDELHDAFRDLLDNLRLWRPYVPEAVIDAAQASGDATGQSVDGPDPWGVGDTDAPEFPAAAPHASPFPPAVPPQHHPGGRPPIAFLPPPHVRGNGAGGGDVVLGRGVAGQPQPPPHIPHVLSKETGSGSAAPVSRGVSGEARRRKESAGRPHVAFSPQPPSSVTPEVSKGDLSAASPAPTPGMGPPSGDMAHEDGSLGALHAVSVGTGSVGGSGTIVPPSLRASGAASGAGTGTTPGTTPTVPIAAQRAQRTSGSTNTAANTTATNPDGGSALSAPSHFRATNSNTASSTNRSANPDPAAAAPDARPDLTIAQITHFGSSSLLARDASERASESTARPTHDDGRRRFSVSSPRREEAHAHGSPRASATSGTGQAATTDGRVTTTTATNGPNTSQTCSAPVGTQSATVIDTSNISQVNTQELGGRTNSLSAADRPRALSHPTQPRSRGSRASQDSSSRRESRGRPHPVSPQPGIACSPRGSVTALKGFPSPQPVRNLAAAGDKDPAATLSLAAKQPGHAPGVALASIPAWASPISATHSLSVSGRPRVSGGRHVSGGQFNLSESEQRGLSESGAREPSWALGPIGSFSTTACDMRQRRAEHHRAVARKLQDMAELRLRRSSLMHIDLAILGAGTTGGSGAFTGTGVTTAQEATRVSQRFCAEVLPTTRASKGTTLRLQADSVFSAWNTHTPAPAHAFGAVLCALRIAERLQVAEPALPPAAVAVVSGHVLAGTAGSAEHRAPTVLGGCATAAPLLCRLAVHLSVPAAADERTHEQVRGSGVRARAVDVVRLYEGGEGEPAQDSVVYELLSATPDAGEVSPMHLYRDYVRGFASLQQLRLEDARRAFTTHLSQYPDDWQAARLSVIAHSRALAEQHQAGKMGSEKRDTHYFRRWHGWEDLEAKAEAESAAGEDEDKNGDPSKADAGERQSSAYPPKSPAFRAPKSPAFGTTRDGAGASPFGEAPEAEDVQLRRQIRQRRQSNAAGENDTTFSLGSGVPQSVTDQRGRVWRRAAKRLGKGAFGEVWLAMGGDGGLVALKAVKLPAAMLRGARDKEEQPKPQEGCMFPFVDMPTHTDSQTTLTAGSGEVVEGLLQEVVMLSSLRHDNIVSYLASTLAHDFICIVMEYLPGGSLHGLLNFFEKRLPTASVQRYVRDMLRGLDFLHHRSVVHRDMKPHNVLLTTDGECKLADFGASMLLTRIGDGGGICGTPHYMAPEACRGAAISSSDVWSLGILVSELLTGSLPWPQERPFVAAAFIQRLGATGMQPELPATLPQEALEWCRMCLRRNAEQRPTLQELKSHPFVVGGEVSEHPHTPALTPSAAPALSS